MYHFDIEDADEPFVECISWIYIGCELVWWYEYVEYEIEIYITGYGV